MKIRMKLLLMILLPLFICGAAIGTISIMLARDYLNTEQETILKVALEGFTDDVNIYQEQDVDITVFEGDTRVESSIDGVIGTKASDIVIEKVIKQGQEYFDTGVNVQGIPYYGYYVPTDDGMLFAGKPRSVVLSNLDQMATTVIGLAVVFLVVCGVVAVFLARTMSTQIHAVSKIVKSIAEGDLTIDVADSKSKDELGETNRASKGMLGKLVAIMRKSTDIADNVNLSAEELNSASMTTLHSMEEATKAIEEISDGLQTQNEAVQHIAENVSEISNDIDEINQASNDISNCSVRLNDSGNLMKEKMTNVSESNEKVNNSIADISEKIKDITAVIENVKGIVSIIGDISSQTNLLSLNASIEAARAGEAGRGFSVVAESISDLSEDTSKQVGQITTIINTLVKDFDECLSKIGEAVVDGKGQKADIESAILEFNGLAAQIKETSEKAKIIDSAVEKTINGVSSISAEVEELSSISENSAASAEQIEASASNIHELMQSVSDTADKLNQEAEELKEQLAIFTI